MLYVGSANSMLLLQDFGLLCVAGAHLCPFVHLQNARARRQGQLAPAAKRELADFNNEACECK